MTTQYILYRIISFRLNFHLLANIILIFFIVVKNEQTMSFIIHPFHLSISFNRKWSLNSSFHYILVKSFQLLYHSTSLPTTVSATLSPSQSSPPVTSNQYIRSQTSKYLPTAGIPHYLALQIHKYGLFWLILFNFNLNYA